MNMQETARAENDRARRVWWYGVPTRQIDWSKRDPGFDQRLVPRVMSCLRDGLGVDDMAANGTCTADEARQVVAWMRKNGSLGKMYEARR